MRPVFANSAWVGAPDRFLRRSGRWGNRRLRVRYGLFVHPVAGPVLIDTGYTAHSLTAPGRSLALRAYSRALAPRLIDTGQPAPFLAACGLTPADITTVIVTHFHADHVSGLAAFPSARILCSRAAWDGLTGTAPLRNIRHGIFAELVPPDTSARVAMIEDHPACTVPHLPEGYDLFGDGSVLAIPLPGHAPGHLGVLFATHSVPLLYATDVQWVIDALPAQARPRLATRLISDDAAAAQRSADVVEAFRRAGGAVVLCHDDALTPFDIENGASL